MKGRRYNNDISGHKTAGVIIPALVVAIAGVYIQQ